MRMQRGPQLLQVVQEACHELHRSPKDAAEILKSLEQDWVTDLKELASLSDVGWQYLRIPAMLKVVLKRRCDELFELVPQLRDSKSKPSGRLTRETEHGSSEMRASPSWRNPNAYPRNSTSQYKLVNEGQVHDALPIEVDREEASGESSHLMELVRRSLKQSGVNSLRDINRIFGQADVNQDGILNHAEFNRLVKQLRIPGIDTPQKIHALWNMFDRDKNGMVSSYEFLRTIRGRMNPQREAVAKHTFNSLDTENTGTVHRWVLDMNFDPFVEATERDVPILEVLKNFLAIGRAPEHQTSSISQTEFLAYYDNVSAMVDSDTQFAKIVRGTWAASRGPSREEAGHSAAAISSHIRQLLATNLVGPQPERQLAQTLWQLLHDVVGKGIDRDSFDFWIDELRGRSLAKVDRQILFEVIDVDGDGLVLPTDFLCALQINALKRQRIIEDAFLRISNSAGHISWQDNEIPDHLLELHSMSHDTEPLSKHDFMNYYLSCGILLQDDRTLESILATDWPFLAKSLPYGQHLGKGLGSVASIAKGLGSVNPQRAWLSLAGDIRPGSARPGRHGSIPLNPQSAGRNRISSNGGWRHVAWPMH
eukprot:gnl/MRDRNA2_/MRDRNA2_19907_c0_seq1.p1 gnl/MRDRNA2_/MRDRNA2_19907_c0~~gnl/MRDRNA2_/MRDRNA2_19907_c0_seq1.p1  ORF type:complete len:594 (+),score=102.65 gnl/MRDRNA2_/MRDRNA2_19907_c0_seq1:101-1882(+)